jgi:N-acetylglucosaminyl-diphospho-decaprenol L-rhamnosyltransferase
LASWSFITVTYNSSAALKEYWCGVLGADDIEWIVVDNASIDASEAVARELGASVVIRNSQNLGFSRACNQGLEQATGEFVGFVNPDVTVDKSTLEVFERMLHEQELLVAPQLVYPDGQLQPNGRGVPTLAEKVMNRVRPPRTENNYYKFAGPTEIKPVTWITGAAVLARRDTFDRLNGWDERFFLYYEDVDLSLRAWQHDIPVKLVGTVQWTHAWARETSTLRLGPWKREVSSLVKFYRKYPWALVGFTKHSPWSS